jgi:transcriptional regulator with XRE-family HTH domain
MSFFASSSEISKQIAQKAQTKRLSLNMSQKTLSEHSGVSFGVLKKFERTGKISLESLVKLASILDALGDFQKLFQPMKPEDFTSLDDLLNDKSRKRGRL